MPWPTWAQCCGPGAWGPLSNQVPLPGAEASQEEPAGFAEFRVRSQEFSAPGWGGQSPLPPPQEGLCG